jgi:hypothetical protein
MYAEPGIAGLKEPLSIQPRHARSLSYESLIETGYRRDDLDLSEERDGRRRGAEPGFHRF